MSGNLPPGCTQWECDHAQGADEDAPQQWHQCAACEGSGVEVFVTWEYEHSCGFGHASTDERPCSECKGEGGFLDDVTPDGPEGPSPPIQMQDGECPF